MWSELLLAAYYNKTEFFQGSIKDLGEVLLFVLEAFDDECSIESLDFIDGSVVALPRVPQKVVLAAVLDEKHKDFESAVA